jgi:hypothetical protein
MTRQASIEIKHLNNSAAMHPSRKRPGKVIKSTHPLGEAPDYFRPDELLVWAELQRNAPASVLTKADRHIVETTCLLLAKMRRRHITAAEIGRLMSCLSCMGLTPSDRSKITAPEAMPDNPFAEFN